MIRPVGQGKSQFRAQVAHVHPSALDRDIHDVTVLADSCVYALNIFIHFEHRTTVSEVMMWFWWKIHKVWESSLNVRCTIWWWHYSVIMFVSMSVCMGLNEYYVKQRYLQIFYICLFRCTSNAPTFLCWGSCSWGRNYYWRYTFHLHFCAWHVFQIMTWPLWKRKLFLYRWLLTILTEMLNNFGHVKLLRSGNYAIIMTVLMTRYINIAFLHSTFFCSAVMRLLT